MSTDHKASHRMSAKPRYLDGVPQNLEAAAWDAIDWMEKMQSVLCHHSCFQSLQYAEDRRRIKLALAALKRFLPGFDTAIFEVTPEPKSEATE